MLRTWLAIIAGGVLALAPGSHSPAPARILTLPPATAAILDEIYSGQEDRAIAELQKQEASTPDNPLPYLLQAEATWWKFWCAAAEYKYGMTMARHREKLASDQAYLDLTARISALAERSLRQHETAEMRLYLAMADALAARLYALRGETRATARAGVRARANFLVALAEDGSLYDAYTGLGLYNYYVDTLSTMARILRFVMGIPGGSKEEGIRQLKQGIQQGQLTPAVARFYLAINLENYDQRYAEALEVIRPLALKYPGNPLYQLVSGDLEAKLGHRELAEASYKAAESAALLLPDVGCRQKMLALSAESLRGLEHH